MAELFVGTSGFFYPHWRGSFYPQNLAQKDWFLYYTKHFNTVELNVSFYRLPKKETFAKWRTTAGPNFVFSVKASRFITHVKKLKDCQTPLKKFFEAALGLINTSEVSRLFTSEVKERNCVLWQLPPGLKADEERLTKFLKVLPQNWRYAFEFRNPSWDDKKVFGVLRQYSAAVVFQDFPEWPTTEQVTTDFVYLRFHGREKLYSSCYTEKQLEPWAEKIKIWQKEGKDAYIYFNNDAMGYAIENAQTLKSLCLKKS